MNKITKMLACAGLAAAAIGVIAAPANAAPESLASVDEITIASDSDRVEGPWIIRNDENAVGTWFAVSGSMEITSGSRDEAIKNGVIASFPAVGSTGPIRIGTACVGLTGTSYGSMPILGVMDCAKAIDVTMGADGRLAYTSESGAQLFVDLFSEAGFRGFVVSPIAAGGGQSWREYVDLTALAPVTADVVPVTVTGPAGGSTVADTTPTFTGTGEAGAEIVVTDSEGNTLCSTTVGTDGTWSCDSSVELPMGPTTVTVEQTDADGETTTDSVDFTIALPAPIVAPGIAALAIGALGAGVMIKRRKK